MFHHNHPLPDAKHHLADGDDSQVVKSNMGTLTDRQTGRTADFERPASRSLTDVDTFALDPHPAQHEELEEDPRVEPCRHRKDQCRTSGIEDPEVVIRHPTSYVSLAERRGYAGGSTELADCPAGKSRECTYQYLTCPS